MLRKMAHRRQTLGSRWQLVGHLLLLRRQIGLEGLDPGLIALFVAISTATGAADKPLWPTPLTQERRATRLVRKARLKLAQRPRPSHARSPPETCPCRSSNPVPATGPVCRLRSLRRFRRRGVRNVRLREIRTRRWRKVDSNLRFPNRSAPFSRQPGPSHITV